MCPGTTPGRMWTRATMRKPSRRNTATPRTFRRGEIRPMPVAWCRHVYPDKTDRNPHAAPLPIALSPLPAAPTGCELHGARQMPGGQASRAERPERTLRRTRHL